MVESCGVPVTFGGISFIGAVLDTNKFHPKITEFSYRLRTPPGSRVASRANSVIGIEELHRDKAPQSDSTASQVRVKVRPAKTCQRASAESYRKSKEENRRTFSLKTIVLLEDIFPNSSADHAQQDIQ
ncbi:predicted protein [Aspergillus terreus NIH2624]|uniref:Uncharacterized protein n=1 Tax=Aspergillus terreus (strain NIH 2624 / FGSC A1156) TaxID=341663 RepID=Q0CCJ3_ASPTN|nr:uncharacterized protein ATEG_08591 [Aspergillus terreus NIH2624]EAU30723.1 predicted protein [Aspergillus terreus NIH2624]